MNPVILNSNHNNNINNGGFQGHCSQHVITKKKTIYFPKRETCSNFLSISPHLNHDDAFKLVLFLPTSQPSQKNLLSRFLELWFLGCWREPWVSWSLLPHVPYLETKKKGRAMEYFLLPQRTWGILTNQ